MRDQSEIHGSVKAVHFFFIVLNSHITQNPCSDRVHSFRSFFRPHAFIIHSSVWALLSPSYLLHSPFANFQHSTNLRKKEKKKKNKREKMTLLLSSRQQPRVMSINNPIRPSVSFHPSSLVPSTINLRSVSQLRCPNKSSPLNVPLCQTLEVNSLFAKKKKKKKKKKEKSSSWWRQ